MKINLGIIGAMSCEIEELKQVMTIRRTEHVAGMTFYMGKIEHTDIVLTISGVGKVNAAACAQLLISKFNVTHIINTGVAGAISETLAVGDVVIASDVTYHDVRPAQMKNCFPFQDSFPAHAKLIALAQQACNQIKEITHYYTGRIVTGEAFIEDSKTKQWISQAYHAACVEMEGAAIGHVAYINQIPFIILRSISDKANEKATISFETFAHRAAKTSCQIVMQMLIAFENNEKQLY